MTVRGLGPVAEPERGPAIARRDECRERPQASGFVWRPPRTPCHREIVRRFDSGGLDGLLP